MRLLGRRPFLTGGLGLLGAGAVTWGGSLAVCSVSNRDMALLIRPLWVALGDLHEPEQIGQAWLANNDPEGVFAALAGRPALTSTALIPDSTARLEQLRSTIRQEFSGGEVVLADRWVVARSEAEIAASWVAARKGALL